MKKILLAVMAVLFIGIGFAYTPTLEDEVLVIEFTNLFEQAIEQRGEDFREKSVDFLTMISAKTTDQRYKYVLTQVALDLDILWSCIGCGSMSAGEWDFVLVNYVLYVDGEVRDTNISEIAEENGLSTPGEPIGIKLGNAGIIEWFANAIYGMVVGEEKTVIVSPEEWYGERDEDLVVTVSLDQVLVNGGEIVMWSRIGVDGFYGIVVEITDEYVVIDANHPLAGKNLTFEIELVEIQ